MKLTEPNQELIKRLVWTAAAKLRTPQTDGSRRRGRARGGHAFDVLGMKQRTETFRFLFKLNRELVFSPCSDRHKEHITEPKN